MIGTRDGDRGFALWALIAVVGLIQCGSDEDEPEPCPTCVCPSRHELTITLPDSSTVWTHQSYSDTVAWSGSNADSVQLRLYRNNKPVDFFPLWTDNDGLYVDSAPVPSTLTSGGGYRVQVIDSRGRTGWSAPFEISTDSLATIVVRKPEPGVVWVHGGKASKVTWSVPLSGADSVRIVLYDGPDSVDLFTDWTPNDGAFTPNRSVAFGWGEAENYRLKVIDRKGYFGWSKPFEIANQLCETIEVTSPTESTVWKHGRGGVRIAWEECCCDSVSISLYAGESPVQILTSASPDTGVYVRRAVVNPSWEPGEDYRIRVESSDGSFGYSPFFEIEADSLESITVRKPDSSTRWYNGQQFVNLSWRGAEGDSVKVDLYVNDTLLSTLCDFTDTARASICRCTLEVEDSVPEPAFRVRITDNLGNYGWSGLFSIDDSGTVAVAYPADSTLWIHGESTAGVKATNVADSVRAALYRGDSLVAEFCGWHEPDDSLVCEGPDTIPSAWTPGGDYRIRVEDNTGNYGWSNRFGIVEDTAGFEVLSPDSTTVWYHGQSNLAVTVTGVRSDSLSAELYRESSFVEVFVPPTALDTNESTLVRSSDIPTWWSPGAGYRLKVIDGWGLHTWSDRFRIAADSLERITVAEPGSSTVLYHNHEAVSVEWSDVVGDSVRVLLYRDDTEVARWCDWDVDNGSCAGPDTVKPVVGTGTGFRIKVEDNRGYHGFSEEFSILADSLDVITVVSPDSSSVWYQDSSAADITWSGARGDSATVVLYRNDSFIGMLCDDVVMDSTQRCTPPTVVKESWGTGSDFRVLITDNLGYYGWSNRFTIRK